MTDDPDTTRIDPDVVPADIDLPAALGAAIAAFYGFDRVATVADWLDALDAGLEPTGRPLGLDDLCTTDESAHVLTTGDREQAYQCVIDPMLVPFVTDEPGTVRSVCPTTETDIVVDIDSDGVRARPETAVFSLGIAPDAAAVVGDPPLTPGETYGSFCPYGNAFATEAAYEEWAAETDAITTAIPLEDGVAIAGEMADRLVAAGGDGTIADVECECCAPSDRS